MKKESKDALYGFIMIVVIIGVIVAAVMYFMPDESKETVAEEDVSEDAAASFEEWYESEFAKQRDVVLGDKQDMTAADWFESNLEYGTEPGAAESDVQARALTDDEIVELLYEPFYVNDLYSSITIFEGIYGNMRDLCESVPFGDVAGYLRFVNDMKTLIAVIERSEMTTEDFYYYHTSINNIYSPYWGYKYGYPEYPPDFEERWIQMMGLKGWMGLCFEDMANEFGEFDGMELAGLGLEPIDAFEYLRGYLGPRIDTSMYDQELADAAINEYDGYIRTLEVLLQSCKDVETLEEFLLYATILSTGLESHEETLREITELNDRMVELGHVEHPIIAAKALYVLELLGSFASCTDYLAATYG